MATILQNIPVEDIGLIASDSFAHQLKINTAVKHRPIISTSKRVWLKVYPPTRCIKRNNNTGINL